MAVPFRFMRLPSSFRASIALPLAVFLLPILLAGRTCAHTVGIEEQGIHVDIPDNWTVVVQSPTTLSAIGPEPGTGLSIGITGNPEEKKSDEAFYLNLVSEKRQDKAKADHASLVTIAAGTATLGGVPAAYIQTEEPLPDGNTLYNRDYLIAANDRFYAVSFYSGDPFTDQKMQAISDTFRFDTPPVLPEVERPFYHRLEQVSGGLAIVAAVVVIVLFLRKRRHRAR